MQDYTKRSADEAKTYELFDQYLNTRVDHNPVSYGIAGAFRAMWTAALSPEKITHIASAMYHKFDQEAVQDELTKMVRAKVLRSRMNGAVRLYEVNY